MVRDPGRNGMLKGHNRQDREARRGALDHASLAMTLASARKARRKARERQIVP